VSAHAGESVFVLRFRYGGSPMATPQTQIPKELEEALAS